MGFQRVCQPFGRVRDSVPAGVSGQSHAKDSVEKKEENIMIKIHTDKAPAAVGPYSQAMVSNGMVYTSGQIAINPLTNTIEAATIQEQTNRLCAISVKF